MHSSTIHWLSRGAIAASIVLGSVNAWAVTAPSFAAPVQYTSGGQTIVKIVSTLRTPALDANQVDTGADTITYLDINNDGTAGDFVTADHDSKLVRVHLAPAGGGSAYVNYDITAGSAPTDLAVADVDGDGLPDIITCENGCIVVYLNTTAAGTVSFGSGTSFTGNDESASTLAINKVTIADVDNDGLPDLIGVGTLGLPSTSSRVQVVVFRNTTASHVLSFAASVVYGAQGSGDFVVAANLTRNATGGTIDLYPEIIVGSNNGDFSNGNTLTTGHGSYSVFLNKGDGTYGSDGDPTPGARPIRVTTYDHINGLAVGDVTADGNRDLLLEEGQINGGGQTFIQLFPGNGDGSFGANGQATSTQLVTVNPTGTIFQGDVVLGDFNGDGTIDVAVTDPLTTHGIIIFALDPTAAPSVFFPSSFGSNPGYLTIATGAGAQAIGVTDSNGDGLPDLLVANNDAHNLTLLVNSGVPPVVLPSGRNIAFGTPSVTSTLTCDLLTIPVLRGKGSIGQVIEYFSVSGTAVQYLSVTKPNDYQFLQPSGGQQQVTFPAPPAIGANEQNILLKIIPSKSTALKTITLSLLEPVGYADIGSPSTITIPIAGGHPAILKAPSGLVFTPTKFVTLGTTKIGFTGSDWNFAVTEVAVTGAPDLAVSIETTSDAVNGPWKLLLGLTGKNGRWTGMTRQLPASTQLFFRAHATASGFTDGVGPASKPLCVVSGPELSLNVAADTSSDGSGHSIHVSVTPPPESIIYHVTVANVGAGAAANVIVNFPIPAHTSYVNVTNKAGSTHTVTKSGKVITGGWLFATIPAHTTYEEDLIVDLDLTAAFSTTDPTKGYGYIVKATGFNASGVLAGFISGKAPVATGTNLVKEFDTQVIGPISMDVSADLQTAHPGDIITYTIHANNNSTSALTFGVVTDHIPPGTTLETVYAANSLTDANSSGQALPNPGPFTNPQLIYVRNPSGASIDVTGFTDPAVRTLALGFLLAKPTQEFDFITLSAQYAAMIPVNGTPAKGSTPAGPTRAQFILDFANAVTELVNAEILIPTAVKWPIPMLPPKGTVTIKYQVRVIYDLLKISLGNPDGVPTSIANNNYNFTIAASGKTLSALYGAKPAPVSTALILTAPAAEPVIALSKFAYGDHDLNNPNLHGNGSQIIAGLGELTTAIQGHGFDFELFYYNYGANDAHDVVIHETIPAGAVLSGYFAQSVNGVPPPLDGGMVAEQISYYDALGKLIPSASAALNYGKVKSMDIRLSGFNNLTPLKSGDYGTIRYTITPTVAAAAAGKPPTLIQSLGGYDSTRKRSDPLQGAYISCADLSATVSASPDSLLVKVISDVSFDLHYTKGVFTAKPLDYVPFDFTLNQNGDATSGNTPVNFVIPQGAILATDTNTDMQHGPKYSDRTPGGPSVTVTGQNATLNFGSIAGHVKHTFRIYLQVNSVSGDFDPALRLKHRLFFDTDPTVTPSLITAAHMSARSADRTVLSTPPQTVPPSAATTKQTVQLLDPTAAHLSVTRSSPYTVDPSQNFNYIITFTNSGDVDATNVKVGMQIPYFTHFVSTTNGSVTVIGQGTQPNTNRYTTTLRTPAQVKATGGGPNIITWPFGTLPAHSSGSITVTVQVQPGFVNDCIRDHSLYVSSDNAASAVLCPNPIGTWVVGKNFDVSKWEVLGCFCEHLGIPINKTTSPALQAYVTGLTRTSKVHVVGGLDFLQMRNGAMVFPLGHNQVIALVSEGGGGLSTGPGSQVISNDGGSILATGDANAITINGLITGGPLVSTSATAQFLLQNGAGIIAAGGGNIIAAGGGNLISQDGGTFSLISNEIGGASSLIHAITAGLIATGGGNAVANGWGLITGVGLISQDGGGLISQDGGGLIGQDGGGLLSLGVASLVVTSSGQVISNDGGSVISNDGGSLIGEGGSTFKGGPSN